MESMGRTVFSHGVMNWTKDDHWGYTNETGVMLKVVDGKFVVEKDLTPSFPRRSNRDGGAPAAARPQPSPSGRRIQEFHGLLHRQHPRARRPDQRRRLCAAALATVLVFAVTRVIFIPQGEFVAFGALTLALFQTGKVPGTVWFLLILAGVAALATW
jgi:hypothetical protein